MKNILFSLFAYHVFLTSSLVSADSLKSKDTAKIFFKFKTYPKWEMSEALKINFGTFIDGQAAALEKQVPGVRWSHKFEELGKVNRDLDCRFIQKVQTSLKGKVKAAFQNLSEGGKICGPGDLPESKRLDFTRQLANVFWNEKWIQRRDKILSLEDFLKEKLKGYYRKPEIIVSASVLNDGYGWGVSEKSLKMLEANPALKRFKTEALKFDPESLANFPDLGLDFQRWIQLLPPHSAAALFQPASKIYLGRDHGPLALLEFLLHEFGHVFHGQSSDSKYQWDELSKTLSVSVDLLQSESIAESFAWLIFKDLKSDYPELAVNHIDKLRFLTRNKPTDHHLVGPALIFDKFYFGMEGNFEGLMEYARFNDVSQFSQSLDLNSRVKPGSPFAFPAGLLNTIPL